MTARKPKRKAAPPKPPRSASRASRRARGLVLVELWLSPEDHETLTRAAECLETGKSEALRMMLRVHSTRLQVAHES